MRSALTVALCFVVALPEYAFAQDSHIASQAMLDALVQQRVGTADRDRETLRALLQRDDVKTISRNMGLDLRRAETAVAALDASGLALLATQARDAQDELAGGKLSRLNTVLVWILIALVGFFVAAAISLGQG